MLLFALATTLIWGLAELFYKRGARPDEKWSHLKICVFVGAVMGLHAIVTLIASGEKYDFSNIIYYLPVSLCYVLSMTLSYFGMRFIEESISDPIENTSGALCTLMCVVFLRETVSPLAAAAIIVTVIGIVGIGWLEGSHGERKKKLGKKAAIIAFSMPFCYAILDALGSFLDIIYLDIGRSPLKNVTEENIETVANVSYELTFLIFALVLLAIMLIKGEKIGIRGQGDKLLAAVFETGGQLTYVYAMSGNGAIAAPIISSVCVVSLLLSRVFLKEKLTVKQYIFIAAVILGIILLAVAEGE